MIVYALLFWVGEMLNAPAFYWWIWGTGVFFKLVDFGITIGKGGK